MKIAICFFGKYNNKGGLKDFNIGYNNIKKEVLQYKPDIFIHTWNGPNNKLLLKYNPKKILYENLKTFTKEREFIKKNTNGKKNQELGYRSCSMFYSINKVIEMKKEYERINNFKYDCVILTRFDISGRADRLKFDINDNMNNIYLSIDRWENKALPDHWFYSKSENIDICGKMFRSFLNYISNIEYKKFYKFHNHLFNNHYLFKWHFIQNNIDQYIKYKIK